MPSELLEFDIIDFEPRLKEYLKSHTAWNVTAMCPVTNSDGKTVKIYVTVK